MCIPFQKIVIIFNGKKCDTEVETNSTKTILVIFSRIIPEFNAFVDFLQQILYTEIAMSSNFNNFETKSMRR